MGNTALLGNSIDTKIARNRALATAVGGKTCALCEKMFPLNVEINLDGYRADCQFCMGCSRAYCVHPTQIDCYYQATRRRATWVLTYSCTKCSDNIVPCVLNPVEFTWFRITEEVLKKESMKRLQSEMVEDFRNEILS